MNTLLALAFSLSQLFLSIFPSLAVQGNEGMYCTATTVDGAKGWMLTAKHCLPEDKDAPFILNGTLPIQVVRVEGELALVKVNAMNLPIPIAKEDVKQGDLVYGAGFGWAWGKILVMSARVSANYIEVPGWEGEVTLLDHDFANGMSGGPVLNEKGELIGIVQAGNAKVELLSTLKQIKHILKEK